MKLANLLAATMLAATAVGANAAVIFDNFAGLGGAGGPGYTEETRNSNGTFGAVVQFTADTTITGLGVRYRVNNDQDIRFMIFDSLLGGTIDGIAYAGNGGLLYQQVKSFSATASVDFIYSDPLSFTFEAGRRYDIGIVGSTGTLTGSWNFPGNCSRQVAYTEGNAQSIYGNANFSGFGEPMTGGYACVDPHIQLLADNGTDVPEPAMLGLFGLGAIALAAARRRRV
jgi:hypothetical protein